MQVLALYEDFKKACEEAGKQVSSNIETQAQKIRDEVFNLMILGEAKSGKSTFINAYLGKEVVPMDVRQCTSAIIKIKRGNEFKLVARTAAGGETVVNGDEKIREFLKKHATISDKYRNIPITTINNEILLKKKGKKISKKDMESFFAAVAKDNIYNMDIAEYNRLIAEYIRENKDSWKTIITEIEIIYPLPEAMQGITLIDSPGVGAGGNVGPIAEDYIKNANAIIFVKYLKGQAIESTTFMNFLRNTCTDRKKESLFLVFNGKSDLQGSEFASLMEQAVQMYGNDIRTEKIIGVDSKVQLFLNKCRELGTEEAIDSFFEELDTADEDFAPASNCWLKSMRKGGMPVFEEKMEEMSNFGSVHAAIEKFARVANYIQLIEFLDNLEKEYQRYRGMFSFVLMEAKEHVEDPEALAKRIKEKQKEIDEDFTKINEGIEAIHFKYTDNIEGEGIILSKAEEKKTEYRNKLENFKSLTEDKISNATFSEMKKMTFDAIENAMKFRDEITKEIIDECNDKLIECVDDPTQIPAEAFIPNFTESDFDAINLDALSNTSGYEEVESVFTLKKAEKVPYHHLIKHVKLLAENIDKRLDSDIFPIMVNNIVNYVNKATELYKERLICHKRELEEEYQKLLADQKNNENIIARIEELERKLKVIEEGLGSISAMKGELSNYVEE